ncbi:MAG: 50S ribosomal protein L25/general stress protein Ctc [Pseudomonadota bacterium]
MKFVAFERTKQGTGASRRLRNSGKTPGIVYGGIDGKPQLIELDHNALWHALKKEAFHSSVMEMELAGSVTKVLLRDFVMHPYKQQVQHIDFQRVDANTVLHTKVALHYSGEENSPAVKADACLINHVLNELEVACLPRDLPEFIAVDLSEMKKGSSVHLNDVKLPKGVKAVLRGKVNPVLVSATVPVAEEAPVAVEAAPAADAKGGKGKPAAKTAAAKPAAKK